MGKYTKIAMAFLLTIAMATSTVGCSSSENENSTDSGNSSQNAVTVNSEVQTSEKNVSEPLTNASDVKPQESNVPKYIFMFIGDGMSYPQIQSTNYYLNALKNGTSMGSKDNGTTLTKDSDSLSFLSFPVAGSAQTYDSTSFCPDSASTATSLSTGNKTYSGTINMDETGTVSYETISEKLHKQLGYKVGIVSTVNLNHATPAAYYCHQTSRSNYYEIGLELIDSGFEYFAGGGLLKPTGSDNDKKDLYELAEDAGYTVVKSQAEAEKVSAQTGNVIMIDENLADSDAMAYEIDRTNNQWTISDYVEKGIECLYENNDNGFFMMIEGGKIDWACHANDAASTMHDTQAFSDSVQTAIDFYNEHPDETLIIVTGDHETGGLTIGYAGTNYDTFLQNLSNQKISFQKFDDEYVSKYKENKTGFDDVMKDVSELFGLVTEEASGEKAENGVAEDSADNHPTGVTSGKLVLTEYELEKLKNAYDKTLSDSEEQLSQQEYELYGTYEPLSVTITHILNNKSGIAFTSYSHTGLPTAVFAMGKGQELFEGYYDNTDIYFNLAELTGVK
ncbi:MAG: alkaline phosphatase [Ruminococcus flavefaciens]|nr:alkaline phosphatase [Ruminococcus flavefaciens]MCM1228697.1 alkaline phosphatase [Ruminococcus flavefaciens]